MKPNHVQVLDTTLRDGSYAIDFQFTAEDTALIASALESAGVELIEIAHGLGLGADRAGKGSQAATDEAYLRAASDVLSKARFGTFFIPGIGVEADLELAADHGAGFVRIGSNITELEQAEPFVLAAKRLGLYVFCNLMKSYAVGPEAFGERARMAEGFGADVVCLVDSAGGMLPEEVRAYLGAAKEASDVRLGFHGHDNLCMAAANTLTAMDAGATVLDASLQGIGRSEGNAVTEVLVAVLQKRGLLQHMDMDALLDVGEAFVRPLMNREHRTAIGITTGRARFHSSFLGRVMAAATQHAVDVRALILALGGRNQIDAPEALVDATARELAEKGPRTRVRVDMASTQAEASQDFDAEVLARARELREKARKLGKKSVFNIVVTPYELTHVSPYVDTNHGCAISNIMLAYPGQLGDVLAAVDGLVDYVLLDPGRRAVPKDALNKTVMLAYSDHDMWARATAGHVLALFGGHVAGKGIALTGIPPLTARTASVLAELGAEVCLDSSLEDVAAAVAKFAASVSVRPIADAASEADAVLSLSPREPRVGADCVARMRPGAVLYDGGIGSLTRDAVPAAEERGIRVVRVDMRPTLAATALDRIGMRTLVSEHMGRAEWEGVGVVSGGLIGREGEVVVDSIRRPTRVIGIADGKGGILRAMHEDEAVKRVRHAIVRKLLEGDAT